MHLEMIGMGKMRANLVERLTRESHERAVFDANPAAVKKGGREAHARSTSIAAHLGSGAITVDVGNSYSRDH
jgi:6-phosphogluconate dehydrogenase (decarboxylating)